MVVTFLDLGQHMAFLTPLVPIVTRVCNVGTFLEGGTWWKFCSRTIHAEKEIIHMLYVTCQFQFADVPGNRCAEETVHEDVTRVNTNRRSAAVETQRTGKRVEKKIMTGDLIYLSLCIPVTCTDNAEEHMHE
jgi:hypothetical protein